MGAETVERTFSFVDLAGFTALTEAHGDLDAVDLLDSFISLVHESPSAGDELVKSIGDAVMLASRGPSGRGRLGRAMGTMQRDIRASSSPCWCASRFGDQPGRRLSRRHGQPSRPGDRTPGGGQILVTSAVAIAARASGLEVAELGPHRLRNIAAPVTLFEIRFSTSEPSDAIDPVCRMRVEPELAAGSLSHDGQRFWFCSLSCVAAFAADPGRYLIVAGREGA